MKSRTALLALGLIAIALGLFAWFNGLPKSGKALTPTPPSDPWDSYVLYGVNPSSANLIRYEFSSGQLETIGTIQTSSGQTLSGIEAAAYFPAFQNLFAFWRDPSTNLTKLAYVDLQSAQATFVGSDLGYDTITAATAVYPPTGSSYSVYTVRSQDLIDFTVHTDNVVPQETYAAKITVLGAAISYGGTYDMPVTAKIRVGSTDYDPYGGYSQPVNGNLNDAADDEVANDPADAPREYIIPATFNANTSIAIVGQVWSKNGSGSGSSNSHWSSYRVVDSTTDTDRVITLRNGDPVPSLEGFLDQASIKEFVSAYIDSSNNTMALGPNQAIYLFEMGSSLLGLAADFQDLVVLVTLAHNTDELSNSVTTTTGTLTGSININPNNSPNNEFTLVKSDGTALTRDHLHQNSTVDSSGVFYSGQATSLRVKPKGSGTQNTLLRNAQPFPLKNNSAFTISSASPFNVTVRNDQITNGKAMGYWWVDLNDVATGTVVDGSLVHRLARVDHKTGLVTALMKLSRQYQGLASTDAQIFYATYGNQIYRINLTDQTETLLNTITGTDMRTLEFAGPTLMEFDTTTDTIAPVNPSNGQLQTTPFSIGSQDLSTMMFVPVGKDPATSGHFD